VSFTNVTAVFSMLHEPPARADRGNSATRLFRAAPVLHWTLQRTSRAARVGSMTILCWEDQLPAVLPVAGEDRAYILSKGPRVALPEVETITAARHWADGWRGGLLSTCHFDLGFYGPWHREVAERIGSDAVLLIDPAAGLGPFQQAVRERGGGVQFVWESNGSHGGGGGSLCRTRYRVRGCSCRCRCPAR